MVSYETADEMRLWHEGNRSVAMSQYTEQLQKENEELRKALKVIAKYAVKKLRNGW